MNLGIKLTAVRPMTAAELRAEAWDGDRGTAMVFDDGTVLYAARDAEGNGPGAIFGYNAKKNIRFSL